MMKILHINSYYIGSNLYKNLYDIQNNNGLDIDVYVPISTAVNVADKDLGDYTIISSNYKNSDRIFFHKKHKKIYNDIINKYDVDIYTMTHAHSLFSNGYISLRLKKEYGIPYIVAVRNTDVNIFFKKMIHLRKLGIQILEEAEKVIFLAEPYKREVLKKYIPPQLKDRINSKSVVIPNGIDDYWHTNAKIPANPIKSDEIKLLFVGNIDQNKNITTTIKAIMELQKHGYKIDYTIVGSIKDKSLYKTINNLSFVKYIAPQNKEDLKEIYRSNNIFVMPSITETFGLVYAEAMSQGLPIIYSRGQGFDEQFPEGFIGYSVNSLDYIELANKIERVIKNYNSLSNNCLEVKKFSWDKIERKYWGIYESIEKNKLKKVSKEV